MQVGARVLCWSRFCRLIDEYRSSPREDEHMLALAVRRPVSSFWVQIESNWMRRSAANRCGTIDVKVEMAIFAAQPRVVLFLDLMEISGCRATAQQWLSNSQHLVV